MVIDKKVWSENVVEPLGRLPATLQDFIKEDIDDPELEELLGDYEDAYENIMSVAEQIAEKLGLEWPY